MMTELETIKELAKGVLVTSRDSMGLGRYLWDRTQRLGRNVEHICDLSESAQTSFEVDRFCLLSATYFSETGFAGLLGKKNAPTSYPFFKSSSDGILEFCRETVNSKLSLILSKGQIIKIKKIISESWNRTTRMTEAMILSDARNLEDMGAVGIFHELRRFMSQGKNITEVLLHWRKQIDYRYWQARLKDSFRFESVRNLAEQRLVRAEQFMNQLQVETEAKDLKELIETLPEAK
ncbi:MAG: HD domain-containing protein [Planctomycetota bacterium]|jgi:hypothetical protein